MALDDENKQESVNTNYYEALKNEDYKTLLDKEIQLDNARQRALKNSNVGLAAAGFDSSGYGQLAKQGLESQYLQGLQGLQSDFQAQNRANANEYYQHYSSLFADAVDANDLNQMMKSAGYNVEDGTWNTSVDDATKQMLLEQYNHQMNILGGGENAEENSTDIDLSGVATEQNRKAIKDELDFLQSAAGREIFDNLREGDYVKVSDNSDDKHQVYYAFRNGKLVEVDKAEYDKSEHRYWLRSAPNTKQMWVDYNGKNIYNQTREIGSNAGKAAGIIELILGALTGNLVLAGAGAGALAGNSINDNKNKTKKNYDEWLESLKKRDEENKDSDGND